MRPLEYEAKRPLKNRGIRLHIGPLVKMSKTRRSLDFPSMIEARVPKGGQETGPIRTRLRATYLHKLEIRCRFSIVYLYEVPEGLAQLCKSILDLWY
jgi:hypothetical protein